MLRRPHRNRLAVAATAALLSLFLVSNVLADGTDGFMVEDLHYGEVLFHFYQQDYFTALTNLAAYRELDRVSHHEAEAELLQGGLMLSWGQHVEAGKIFERLLAESEDPYIRNRTWFYLGKVRYQRGFLDEAESAFRSISAPLPEDLEAERYNLLARIYLDQGRFSEAAELLTDWEGATVWAAYARFNLGVALVRMGELDAGAALLNKVGTMTITGGDHDELLGLRDRANVALGFAYLQTDLEGESKSVLQRVRLNGPFSNKALLGVGWADTANREYQKALAPWLELSGREVLDSAVQESLLAVPYAFSQMDAEPLAAQYYARALEIFGAEIKRLDSALKDAGDGRLINALLADDDLSMGGWYWQLDSLPDDDRTRYLYFTIADHRFHEGLKSYRDLIALNRHLDEWRNKLQTYTDMLDTRVLAYDERLPAMQERVARFDLESMQESYELLKAHSIVARSDHDVVSIASAEEQGQWTRLVAMDTNPAWNSSAAADLRDKHRVLKGLLMWNMEREFRVRAWRQDRNIDELGEEIARVQDRFNSLDAATASIPGTVLNFDSRIAFLKPRIEMMQGQLQVALAAHSDYLQHLAELELNNQKERLLTYRAQARFALASIFDRMSASSK
ncbi:MAG: tetratricopeptide repeat protein [Xanthomonadales bacterium]|nr:tetratricopeptide repeat protein [Xanthomonadales bacterium]